MTSNKAILEDFVERANNNVDGDFLHLATALDPQWKDFKVNNKSGREGCWRKLKAELDLLKGEEDVARDKDTRLMLLSRKEDCLTSTNLTMIMMERARWMNSPCFEISTFTNEFLDCCNRYRNEPLGADKNSLDWWKAKKEEYPTLAMKYLRVS